MSIASRQAGATVPCPTCGRAVTVPPEGAGLSESDSVGDEVQLAPAAGAGSAPVSPAEASSDVHDSIGTFRPTAAQPQRPASDEPAADSASPTGTPQERAALVSLEESDDDRGFAWWAVKTEFADMDLTPMVDVTFLLLIFFMVTASFSLQKSIEIPPPDPDQEGAAQSIQTPEDLEEKSIIVRIDENDAITIDDEPVDDPDNLAELLADRRRRDQKSELAIDADARARHGTVVLVNDAAVEAEFQRIRLLVRTGTN